MSSFTPTFVKRYLEQRSRAKPEKVSSTPSDTSQKSLRTISKSCQGDPVGHETGRDISQCRLSDELKVGAHWCRACWRFKVDGCEPTQKRLTGHRTPSGKNHKKVWLYEGDPGLDLGVNRV